MGPVLTVFPSSKLNTPPWGFRISVALPSQVTSYQDLVIDAIHYRSFPYVLHYLKHFEYAKEFHVDGLWWNGKVDFLSTPGSMIRQPFATKNTFDHRQGMHGQSCSLHANNNDLS
jgi:hypothetical protein